MAFGWGWFMLALSAWLMLSITVQAAPTDADAAREAVEGWLRLEPAPMGATLPAGTAGVSTVHEADGLPLYHVVNLPASGFVLVAGDDAIEPIVAFVPAGSFDGAADSPFAALIDRDLSARLASLAQVGEAGRAAPAARWSLLREAARLPADGRIKSGLNLVSDIRVPVLLETEWSQESQSSDYLYNYYTPNHYVCGCVATAMAQLMYYHRYPTTAVGTASHWVSVDGSSQQLSLRGGNGSGGAYNWDLMPAVPASVSLSNAQRQAIGAICHDAGVAANMDYTAGGSGTGMSNSRNALIDTFGYANAVNAFNYTYTDLGAKLLPIINPNLDAGYPVLLGVTGTSGGQIYGHAIVCDGYGYQGGTLYHHLNMGWAGYDDVWYNLPDIDAVMTDFSIVDDVVYNIFPDATGHIVSGRVTTAAGQALSGAAVTATSTTATYTATTNTRGIYALTGIPAQTSLTVQVSAAGYEIDARTTYVNTSINYTDAVGNVWGLDFTASPASVAADQDGDGIADEDDNCPLIANADQANADGDSAGDVCDFCPELFTATQVDSDGDGIGDACEEEVAGEHPDNPTDDGDTDTGVDDGAGDDADDADGSEGNTPAPSCGQGAGLPMVMGLLLAGLLRRRQD